MAYQGQISQEVLVDRRLINKYNRAAPRYTSYPTAPHFKEELLNEQIYRQEVARVGLEHPNRPLSLYIHIPFCQEECFYCGCNRMITKDRSRSDTYLAALYQEIDRVGALFDRKKPVVQLHFGGGTPTYLDRLQLQALMEKIRQNFHLLSDGSGDYGIEVDPREATEGKLALLYSLGFNRISFGVQDINIQVQEAVNRVQPLALDVRVVNEAREVGFRSINIDLIYGLPHQTVASFAETLTTVLDELDPDRLAVFNFAHLPELLKNQRKIDADHLPKPDEKLQILEDSIHILEQRGYVYIGMDHFGKPDDELTLAQQQGRLHRNFQGYTTHAECDLVALGVSSISQIGHMYAQNLKKVHLYQNRINEGNLPVFRGLIMNRDDQIRQKVIMTLMCDFRLSFAQIEACFDLTFETYFADALIPLQSMAADGLLTIQDRVIQITPGGKLLIRNVCTAFDRYLSPTSTQNNFSQTI
ncbi:MAG: oxygen-independent coproporphyrinogen III oxidase [Magnetococcales bacterium]|nr:oxygen-independent coproporphyrinogen III oxidase [Magnetococcales bacterium]